MASLTERKAVPVKFSETPAVIRQTLLAIRTNGRGHRHRKEPSLKKERKRRIPPPGWKKGKVM
jgi:hypothetical protein